MADTIREEGPDEEKGAAFKQSREAVNTPEEIKLADKFIKIYEQRKAEVLDKRDNEWTPIQKLYAPELGDEENTEFGFVNVLLPTVEGQVSAMTLHKVSATFQGKGYSDQAFARSPEVIFPSIYDSNNIREKLKRCIRRYELFGVTVMKVQWDPDAWDGFGIPEFIATPLDKVFFDGKIKDILDIQKGEYIAEEIPKSIDWAREEYGDEKADAIALGNADPSFEAELTGDDEDNFTLVEIWRRHPKTKKLQKLEISRCGVLLKASDEEEDYHTKVHGQYPYFIAGKYFVEGEFYCFGDGKLLKPIQELLNNLYHEVVLACKFSAQNRTFVDPNAKINPADFDNDPSHPIPCKDPKNNIYEQQGGGINPVIMNLIDHLLVQVERMTRFSALMTGNGTGEQMTATQAGIQQQQGTTGIDDSKGDISTLIGDATLYALGLCMELWTAGKAFRITENNNNDFEWVDIRHLASVPEMVPADENFKKQWRTKHSNADAKDHPKFMQLEYDDDVKDEEGNVQYEMGADGTTPIVDELGALRSKKKKVMATKQVDLDVSVSIGEGLPTNKMALYNIVLSLAQLQLPDETTGQMRPLLSYKQVKKMVEDYVGIKIEDYLEQNRAMMQGQQQGGNGQPGPVNVHSDIPGANAAGVQGGPSNGIAG